MEQLFERKLRGTQLSELELPDAVAEFMRFLQHEKHASPLTIEAYERDLLRFIGEREALGLSLLLASVTAEDVRAHMHGLIARKLAAATVRRALYALGSFFGWAVRWELVTVNPVLRVTIPRRERVRMVRALSKRERAVLIAAADAVAVKASYKLDRQLGLLVRLLLVTGFRRSEVLALTWRDVDVERGDIFVRMGKGGKSRRVPVVDRDVLLRLEQARDLRLAALGAEPLLDAFVFTNTRGGRVVNSVFYKMFHRVLRHAELSGRGIRPHTLRHTFGTMLCERGVPVPFVKDLLGHEDIGSTMVYVHSTPKALREAVKKLRE